MAFAEILGVFAARLRVLTKAQHSYFYAILIR